MWDQRMKDEWLDGCISWCLLEPSCVKPKMRATVVSLFDMVCSETPKKPFQTTKSSISRGGQNKRKRGTILDFLPSCRTFHLFVCGEAMMKNVTKLWQMAALEEWNEMFTKPCLPRRKSRLCSSRACDPLASANHPSTPILMGWFSPTLALWGLM